MINKWLLLVRDSVSGTFQFLSGELTPPPPPLSTSPPLMSLLSQYGGARVFDACEVSVFNRPLAAGFDVGRGDLIKRYIFGRLHHHLIPPPPPGDGQHAVSSVPVVAVERVEVSASPRPPSTWTGVGGGGGLCCFVYGLKAPLE